MKFSFKHKLGFVSFIALTSLSCSSAVLGMDDLTDQEKTQIKYIKKQISPTAQKQGLELTYKDYVNYYCTLKNPSHRATLSSAEQSNLDNISLLVSNIQRTSVP